MNKIFIICKVETNKIKNIRINEFGILKSRKIDKNETETCKNQKKTFFISCFVL